jgi:hypothetical protein
MRSLGSSTGGNLPRPVVHLDTAAEMVDAIPYLVGFVPSDSVVLVSLRAPRGQVGLTARVDLPDAEWADECARQLVPYLRRDGAARALVAVYPPPPGRSHPAVRAIADAFLSRLAAAGIPLVDLLCVHDGRWWSLVCADEACCPPDGTPVAGSDSGSHSVLGTAMAVEGRVVLPSREALAATLAPVSGGRRRAMERALVAAQTKVADRVWGGRRDDVVAESRALFRAPVQRRLDGGAACSDDEAARLVVALDDPPVRDEVLAWTDGAWGDAARALLAELVPRAVPPFHVVPLTVLGWLAYQSGEGALASLAVERALADDPGYPLARLLDDALSRGVDPAIFRIGLRERPRP